MNTGQLWGEGGLYRIPSYPHRSLPEAVVSSTPVFCFKKAVPREKGSTAGDGTAFETVPGEKRAAAGDGTACETVPGSSYKDEQLAEKQAKIKMKAGKETGGNEEDESWQRNWQPDGSTDEGELEEKKAKPPTTSNQRKKHRKNTSREVQ